MNAQPNLKAWTIFTNNNFKAFPVLKKLYLPGCIYFIDIKINSLVRINKKK